MAKKQQQNNKTKHGCLSLHVKEPVFSIPRPEFASYFAPVSWYLETQNAMQDWKKRLLATENLLLMLHWKIDIKHLKIFMQHQWRQSSNFLRVVSTVILNGVLQKQRKELVQEISEYWRQQGNVQLVNWKCWKKDDGRREVQIITSPIWYTNEWGDELYCLQRIVQKLKWSVAPEACSIEYGQH